MSVKTDIEDAIHDWADMVLNHATAGYQTVYNSGSLGAFSGSVVPAIPSNTYDLNVAVDGGAAKQLSMALLNTDSWTVILGKIQTALRAATGALETVSLYEGWIKITSATLGALSAILISAGTAGSAGGDLLAAINALGASYQVTLNTPVPGTVRTPAAPIIWADENGPVPNAAHVTLKITAAPQVNMSEESMIKVPAAVLPNPPAVPYQEIKTEHELSLSIQGHGYLSQEYLNILHESLSCPTFLEFLESENIAVRDFGTVTNISAMLDDTNEKRFLLEVIFGVAIVTEDDGNGVGRNYINTVQYSGTYNN